MFDLAEVLSLPQSQFSDRGLGSRSHRILSTANDLAQLEWKKIYHTGPLPTDSSKSNIIACRNAEIIVSSSLSLDSLRYIYCRSAPELETLMHLLSPEIVPRYEGRIVSSRRTDFFERKHTYLDTVQLSANEVVFQFSPDTQSIGPFDLCVEFSSLSGEQLKIDRANDFYVRNSKNRYAWRIELDPPIRDYVVQMTLDDALLYCNSYQEWDIPF